MTRAHYRCPSCRWECLSVEFDRCGDAISSCCDAVCERYYLCATCDAREPFAGDDDCIVCLADQFLAKPAEFDGHDAVKAAIADELAGRMRGMLARRQAA